MIHLVAPTVGGAGNLHTDYGGSSGVTEISTATNNFTAGQVLGAYVAAGLYAPPLPSGIPAVQVTSVNGVAAPQYPTANPMVPDVTINSFTSVSVVIAAQNIPTTTTVTLYLHVGKRAGFHHDLRGLSGTVPVPRPPAPV